MLIGKNRQHLGRGDAFNDRILICAKIVCADSGRSK